MVMQLKENSQLRNGKYKITKVLGQGGYGITYLALSRETIGGSIGKLDVEVPVAVKEFFVKDSFVRNEDTTDVEAPNGLAQERMTTFKKKFIKEAYSMSKLNHPHIVKVLDVFEENNTAYYVMQYLDGGSLKELVDKEGPINELKATVLIQQIASALKYMHMNNICHYDVKPANIVLNEHQQAVLIDFGIAKHYEKNGDETTVTPMGMSKGYAPIELYQGLVHEFSPESDIYSLSATFFYLLTGKTPPDAYQVLEKGLGRRPENISEQAWLTIERGMQAVRTDRPKNIGEWSSILTGTWRKAEDDATMVGTPTSKSSHKKHRKLVPAILGLGALGLIGTGAWYSFKPKEIHVPKQIQVEKIPWTDNNGEAFLYTGATLDSIPEGLGRADYADGRLYEGQFVKGFKQDTTAIFRDRQGTIFSGVYRADTLVSGKLTFPEGQYEFIGTFSHDMPYDGIWYDKDHQEISRMIKGKEVLTEQ